MIIQPVAVIYEPISLFGVEQAFVEEQRDRAKPDDSIRPLVMTSVSEIEELTALRDIETMWGVLTEFIGNELKERLLRAD